MPGRERRLGRFAHGDLKEVGSDRREEWDGGGGGGGLREW